MAYECPPPSRCPKCGCDFVVVASATSKLGTLEPTCLLEWACMVCGHLKFEQRRVEPGEQSV